MRSDEEVRRAVMLAIDSCIDEQSLPHYSNSFVQMVGDVIHCDVDGQRFHYRVSLVPVNAEMKD